MDEDKDKELYKEFIEGRIEAIDELIKMYKNDLIYFIYKYVRDFHLAEDISQEVFVYLLQHKENYDFKYSLKSYLYTIARSRALNCIKFRRKIIFIEDISETAISEEVDIENEICREDQKRLVKGAMKKLKKDYRIVIQLIDYEGLTYEETAIIMKKSISQIKALVHNARKRLKIFLNEELKREVKHNEVCGTTHK